MNKEKKAYVSKPMGEDGRIHFDKGPVCPCPDSVLRKSIKPIKIGKSEKLLNSVIAEKTVF